MYFLRVDKNIDWSGMTEPTIERKKRMSRLIKEIRQDVKTDTCFYCGKKTSSFCNSHCVPKFCLENIADNGKVLGPNSIIELPNLGTNIFKKEMGINESGTFQIICRECDSHIFQDYENPDNYINGKTPTKEMLSQIALKNYLKFIYKRQNELGLNAKTNAIIEAKYKGTFSCDLLLKGNDADREVKALDLKNYVADYKKQKQFLETGKGNGYYLFYYNLLDYVVPIALQVPICLIADLEGKIVNNVYNIDPSYRMVDLHICVFPLKNSTAILLFVEEDDKRYRQFRKQFKKLDEQSKLGVINYLIFLYTEDYFMSIGLKDKVELTKLKEIANITSTVLNNEPIIDMSVVAKAYALSNWYCIPNLLLAEYRMR